MKNFAHPDIQHIHDLNGMAILAIDANGVITYANTAAGDLLWHKHTQPVGQHLSLFLGDGASRQIDDKELSAGKPFSNRELLIQGLSGQERWVLLSSQLISDTNGQALTYLFIQDITALKEQKTRLFHLPILRLPDKMDKQRTDFQILEDIGLDRPNLKRRCSVTPVTWKS